MTIGLAVHFNPYIQYNPITNITHGYIILATGSPDLYELCA